MVTARVIACLDIRDGRVVKGIRFAELRDAGDPAARAAAYAEAGADEIVLLDVAATPERRATAVATVAAVRARLDIPLTVGGGVRSVADAQRLLAAGADKVAVNSAAVARPALLRELADQFGTQCIVLSLDAARRSKPAGRTDSESVFEVVTSSGRMRTGLDAIAWAADAARRGAGEILLTSFDRDGTHTGYDLDLIGAVAAAVHGPVVASGGAAHPRDCLEALRAGADAVLAASIFHDGEWSVGGVKEFLAVNGVEVRP
jgi:imidazoleglycerol phosphate synthase cyclase subunit